MDFDSYDLDASVYDEIFLPDGSPREHSRQFHGAQVHQTGRNQEPSSVRHNSDGKLKCSWAVDFDAAG